jgi:hypothetical protein
MKLYIRWVYHTNFSLSLVMPEDTSRSIAWTYPIPKLLDLYIAADLFGDRTLMNAIVDQLVKPDNKPHLFKYTGHIKTVWKILYLA